MDTLTTHPSTAAEARLFTAPHSLSFPGGAGHITPPSEKDGQQHQANGVNTHQPVVNGSATGPAAAPATPAATPGAGQGVSGIIPTLQNLVATVNLDCRVGLPL